MEVLSFRRSAIRVKQNCRRAGARWHYRLTINDARRQSGSDASDVGSMRQAHVHPIAEGSSDVWANLSNAGLT